MPTLKTYRLHKTLHIRQFTGRLYLGDKYLLGIWFSDLVLKSSMLIGLCLGDPFHIQLSSYNTSNDFQCCSSKFQTTNIYYPIIASPYLFLPLLTSIFTCKVRRIPETFNEAKQLGLTVYNLLFLSISLPAIDITMTR
ncbi:unnamed protein product [Didymodactylos carnosus]|uniref:G-protein coupled receptors family 3 profile domain-containing protein n=1 Tax=Didymodactylos carnosus TaxID=1234261 RepID=A0A815M659_9BILA|nr:unnamed protein product [Didymodactylos carnosus]CAF4303598.1 unnamed protein product [Didymodactylos carnosus]